ncbi:MAG TPA: hypothetical protein VNA25_02845 [Phycisphaerae bacterium]|nr:hypothetical protein [Phycisphaerae bacterium]
MTELTDTDKAALLRRICELTDGHAVRYDGSLLVPNRQWRDTDWLRNWDIFVNHALRVLWERGKWEVGRCDVNAEGEWVLSQFIDAMQGWHGHAEFPNHLSAIIAGLEKIQEKPSRPVGDGVGAIDRIADLEKRVAARQITTESLWAAIGDLSERIREMEQD